MGSLRKEVLSLYRELLRLSRKWNPSDAADTQAQREYIERETRHLFRKNRHLTDETVIKSLLQETRKRVEIAQHYGIAYERPAHYPTGLVRKVKKKAMYPISS